MFCSTCGVAVVESLSYCNHCGARIPTSTDDKPAAAREVNPELLVGAMVTSFVFGLLAIAVLLGVMKSVLGLNVGQILAFACLSFLILAFLESVFLLLLFRRNRGTEERAATELSGQSTKELGEPQVQMLQEPLSSVTDHTTRAFDPIYINRK